MPEAYLNVTNPEYASGTPEYLFSGLGEADSASLHCMKKAFFGMNFIKKKAQKKKIKTVSCVVAPHSCCLLSNINVFFFQKKKKKTKTPSVKEPPSTPPHPLHPSIGLSYCALPEDALHFQQSFFSSCVSLHHPPALHPPKPFFFFATPFFSFVQNPVSYPGIQILSLGGVSLFFFAQIFFSARPGKTLGT